jgi:dephospho-CoA kinase
LNTPFIKPFIVGLTGGIASGKSAVAREFESLGVTVIDTDQLARDVVEPGTPALQQLVTAFGPEILTADGRLDRRRMRDRVFADASQRRILESITHPAIRNELARRAAAASGPYQVHVVPLLVEGGSKSAFSRILVVDCPEEIQIERLVSRDNSTEAQAKQILAAQATRAARLSVADEVIENTGDLADLHNKVRTFHRKYLMLATM